MRPNATGQPASLGSIDFVDGVQYFNAGAFSRTPQFQFGNVSRTLPDVRLPRNWNWDALVEKRFRLGERVTLDFRSEFFNLTNSVIFAGPAERIELIHKADDRMIFARGALKAAQWTRGKPPGLYSMTDVLGIKDI